jgi:hypothetical protein
VSAHDAWRRLAAAGPWVFDGLLAVAAAGFGVVTLAQVLPMWAGGLLFAACGLALALIGTRLVVRRDLT